MDLHQTVIPELKKAQESVQWVAVRLDGLTPGNGKRNVLAGALYDVAIEHRVGIVASLSAGAVASAFALVRVQFEALLRGGWVHRAATDDQVQAFFDGKDPPRLNDLVDAIEQHQDFGHGLLGRVRAANIKSLHGFTHGGMEQFQSRYTKEAYGSLSLGPNYPPEAIIESLHVSGTFSLIALRQVARLADDKGLDAEISALIDAPQT